MREACAPSACSAVRPPECRTSAHVTIGTPPVAEAVSAADEARRTKPFRCFRESSRVHCSDSASGDAGFRTEFRAGELACTLLAAS